MTNHSLTHPIYIYNMKVTAEKNEKLANMIFGSIYPLYWNRLEKNGRTREEFHQVLEWFTGFDEKKLQELIDKKVTYRTFFEQAKIHPNAHMIKGVALRRLGLQKDAARSLGTMRTILSCPFCRNS